MEITERIRSSELCRPDFSTSLTKGEKNPTFDGHRYEHAALAMETSTAMGIDV